MLEICLEDPDDQDHDGMTAVVRIHFTGPCCNDCKKRKDGKLSDWEPCNSKLQQLVNGKSPRYEVISSLNVKHGTWGWMERHWQGGRPAHHLTHWQSDDGPNIRDPSTY
jgi:hypothetical protein